MASIELRFQTVGRAESLSLSAAGTDGDFLFVAPDEGAELIRMRRIAHNQFGDPVRLPLADYLDLPGGKRDEADIEGMAVVDDAIWVVGSHGAVRTRADSDTPSGQVPDRLQEIRQPRSRCLLARIPLVHNSPAESGPVLAREAAGTVAARLPSHSDGSVRDTLAKDEHLKQFLDLPGKDNGLDIEGLAATGNTILLGLRGPVLRGWAVILEVEPKPAHDDPTRLRLAQFDEPGKPRYRKHFVDLSGLGVRDLTVSGDDLLILAGPTMLLDGPSRILRVVGGATAPLPPVLHRSSLIAVGPDLNIGTGNDHPEAITILDPGDRARVLVVYDSPAASRGTAGTVLADAHPLL